MEEKTNVGISGGSGLVGSRIVALLHNKYNLTVLGRKDGFDIADPESFSKFKNKNIKFFIHLAGKADVDGSESERELGEESEAWKVNVIGTRNAANFCRENDIKMIYASTDFVFDGKKPEGEFYKEDDLPCPINFYAKTKYEGEKEVEKSGAKYIILRIAYPYRTEFEQKKDFVRAILDRLRQGLEVKAVADHIMCPTFIDDIARALDLLMEKNGNGIYHCVGDTPISPYNAALLIAEELGVDKSLVEMTTREKYFKNKAPRPFNLFLKNDRIKDLGLEMESFSEGLKKINIS